MSAKMKFSNSYTYRDASGREYFVQRITKGDEAGGYGVFPAVMWGTAIPELADTYDTAEEAQLRLDLLGNELKLCAV